MLRDQLYPACFREGSQPADPGKAQIRFMFLPKLSPIIALPCQSLRNLVTDLVETLLHAEKNKSHFVVAWGPLCF